jgi:hypothetical protein
MGYTIVHARNYFNMTCPDHISDVLSVVFTAPYSEGSRARDGGGLGFVRDLYPPHSGLQKNTAPEVCSLLCAVFKAGNR